MALATLLLFLAAVLILAWSRRQRQRVGLPTGKIAYEDMTAWEKPRRPLRSERYGLVGRPDYVLERRGKVIPVEVKPKRRVASPYESDLYQLLAYCLLVEENYARPPYGLLRYAEETFCIPYTPQARRQLLQLLAQMQVERELDEVPPNHEQPTRCRGCGYRERCAFRLDSPNKQP